MAGSSSLKVHVNVGQFSGTQRDWKGYWKLFKISISEGLKNGTLQILFGEYFLPNFPTLFRTPRSLEFPYVFLSSYSLRSSQLFCGPQTIRAQVEHHRTARFSSFLKYIPFYNLQNQPTHSHLQAFCFVKERALASSSSLIKGHRLPDKL